MCLLNYVRYNFTVIFLIIIFIKTSRSYVPDDCVENGSCQCVGNKGEVLDLTPLSTLNTPLIAATNEELFIYHPCSDVSLNSVQDNDCRRSFGICYFTPAVVTPQTLDYHKVLSNVTFGHFSKLAVNDEAVFRINEKRQIEIVFTHTNGSVTNKTYVILDCDENVESYKLVVDKNVHDKHILTLTSKYSCLKTQHHLSGGAIFIIIVVVFFAIYFLGGILVLKFIRGATGIEMIPNHEFWCKLPQMAQDGFTYLKSCGKTAPDSYEKI